MIKLLDILNEAIEEEKKKADRCLRIARSKYDKPSMYRSGAIVRCRKGDIWKDLKEEDYFTGSKFIDDEGNEFSVEQIYNFVKKNETKYYISNFPLDKIKHNIEWWNKNYDIKNPTHKERMMNADTSFPLLVIIEKNCNFSVADGLNRLYKAIKIENKQTLPIYLINKSEIEQISNKLMSEEPLHKWFSRRGGEGNIWKGIKENEFVAGVWGDEDNNYSVDKLIKLVKDRQPINVLIDKVIDDNLDLGTKEGNFADNIKNPTELFYKRTMNANTQYPILVSKEGWIIDGSHRVAKLKWEGKKYIKAHIISKSDLELAKISDEDELKRSSHITYESLNEKQKESPHKWFSRRGGKGSSSGWVDCNTCRDGKCKQCGRQKGEKRAKYPSCRPTPAACKDPGKGKTWGKTK